MLACPWTASAFADSATTDATASERPSLSFMRPIKDERFFDYPIFVQVQVSNFNLLPPALAHGSQPVNSGHLQYSMDDYPVCTTDDTQVMIGKKLGNNYLPAGFHLLKAQLVDVNGTSLKPPVMAITEIFTGHPAATQVNHSLDKFSRVNLTDEELFQLEIRLEELQSELRKLEHGSTGYLPTPQGGANEE